MTEKPTYEELEKRVYELERTEFERNRAEESLQKSEERFRMTFHTSPDSINLNRASDGMYIDINEGFTKIMGYTRDEVIGKTSISLDIWKNPADRKRLVDGLAKTGIVENLEARFIGKDGKIRVGLMSARLLRINDEDIILSITRDITEIKRVELVLRESERRMKSIFRAAPIGIGILINRVIQDVNERFCETIGYSKDELIGQSSRIVYPTDEDYEYVGSEKYRMIKEKGTGTVETRFKRKDGEIINVLLSSTPLDPMDLSVGVTFTALDITERKRAEEALKVSEERFRALFEQVSIGIAEVDTKTGRFISINQKYCDIAGYSIGEMIAMSYARITHPDDIQTDLENVRKLGEGEIRIYSREKRYIRKDGEIVWVNLTMSPIWENGNQSTRHIAVVEDITERKRMEEELLRAQKLESVGVLAGGIAHDFNNILTTIIGNIFLAKMRLSQEDEVFDLLNEAEKGSARAQSLTKQLLTFAKGGAPLKETASIEDILKESCSFVLRGSKSGCEFSIAEDLWPAEVDVGQISQVINNIVINANQAMPEGGIIQVVANNLIIEDRHGLPVKPGRYIRISVIDQGVGIAQKHLLNIFDPYFTTKQVGSGLGLATTYSIIRKHNGHITVDSQMEVGTTFHIYLPASEKAVPEKEEIRLIKGQGRILVMDDEAPLRELVGKMLGNLGYEPEFAEDGAEAIEMYKGAKAAEKPYDAVILDLTVPGGMGGKEAINKLLEIDPEVRAIVSSGYSDDPVLANFQEYGFKGMMPKPFESLSLGKVLHEVLQGEKD